MLHDITHSIWLLTKKFDVHVQQHVTCHPPLLEGLFERAKSHQVQPLTHLLVTPLVRLRLQ